MSGAASAPKGYLAGQKLVVEGVTNAAHANRAYDVFVPDSHDGDRTFPLVIELHGDGGTGAGMRRALDLESASAGRAILVFPNAFGGWDLERGVDENDDIRFMKALVDTLAKNLCVDRARVFAAGYSNGGYFANQLACKVGGSLLRGIASHAGGGPYGGDGEYDDQGNLVCAGMPVPALISHGVADDNVLLTEGQKSRAHWTRVNGCGTSTKAFDPSPCVAYDGCAKPVVYCEVPSVGHVVWPEGGAKATWSFFTSL